MLTVDAGIHTYIVANERAALGVRMCGNRRVRHRRRRCGLDKCRSVRGRPGAVEAASVSLPHDNHLDWMGTALM